MRINGVGKLVAAFVLFLAASALAIHESKPPPPPPESRPSSLADATAPIDPTPPSRAIHDEVPPWVKYAAAPPSPAPASPAAPLVVQSPPIEPPPALVEPNGDYVDSADRCPDSPSRDDDREDGCPEPAALTQRIILID